MTAVGEKERERETFTWQWVDGGRRWGWVVTGLEHRVEELGPENGEAADHDGDYDDRFARSELHRRHFARSRRHSHETHGHSLADTEKPGRVGGVIFN